MPSGVYIRTEKYRKNMSLAMKGKPSWNKGKKLSKMKKWANTKEKLAFLRFLTQGNLPDWYLKRVIDVKIIDENNYQLILPLPIDFKKWKGAIGSQNYEKNNKRN